ncbi:hypothetical protein HpHA307_14940 [Helicobacter pylori]
MKKFIKMLSYSKEGRNIKRLLLLPFTEHYTKKKKKTMLFELYF